jgi:hypothetical protein
MPSALVVIDMLNTYDFEDGDDLAESVRATIPNIRTLLDRAADEDVPVIYVNDNYGDWNSSADELVESGLEGRFPTSSSRSARPRRVVRHQGPATRSSSGPRSSTCSARRGSTGSSSPARSPSSASSTARSTRTSASCRSRSRRRRGAHPLRPRRRRAEDDATQHGRRRVAVGGVRPAVIVAALTLPRPRASALARPTRRTRGRAAAARSWSVGIHGDEPAAARVDPALCARRAAGARLHVVHDLNPDGSRRGTRQNARGVD